MNPVLDLMAAASAPDSPLTPQQRLVFAEYLTGASDAEISARLSLQLGTVKAHLQAARARLNDTVPRRLIRAAARAARGEGGAAPATALYAAEPLAAGMASARRGARAAMRGGAPTLPVAPVVLAPAPIDLDARVLAVLVLTGHVAAHTVQALRAALADPAATAESAEPEPGAAPGGLALRVVS